MSPTARRKSEERVISFSEWLRFCGEVRMAEEAPVATQNTSAVVSTCFTWGNYKHYKSLCSKKRNVDWQMAIYLDAVGR